MSRTKWKTLSKPPEPESKLPKGFTCECGQFEEYTGYVFAHWRDYLECTCHVCGRKHSVVCGHASLIFTPIAVPQNPPKKKGKR